MKKSNKIGFNNERILTETNSDGMSSFQFVPVSCLYGAVFHTRTQRMDENELSNKIVGAAMEVHRTLGPGLPIAFWYENVVPHGQRTRMTRIGRISTDTKSVCIRVIRAIRVLSHIKLTTDNGFTNSRGS